MEIAKQYAHVIFKERGTGTGDQSKDDDTKRNRKHRHASATHLAFTKRSMADFAQSSKESPFDVETFIDGDVSTTKR